MIRVALPYPHKALWPNGRPHHMGKAREVKKHRLWADGLTLKALAGKRWAGEREAIPVRIIVTRKAAGVYPDADNCVAAAKAYLDGIAGRLGINDRAFLAPVVEFRPEITGEFEIVIGGGV